MPQNLRSKPASDPAAEPLAHAFRRGVVQSLPFLLVLIPFGMLFGVVAQASGFDLLQTMGFSILVLAGASQFTAIELLSQDVPVVLVITSALAVNLRMAMYSAALVPVIGNARPWERALAAYALTDQSYALTVREAEDRPRATVAQRMAFFWGVSLVVCPPWMVFTLIGATVGNLIPPGWPLDFAVPITFLSMVAPMLRNLPQVVAAGVAVAAALALAGMPSGTGLLIAAPAGMIAGALMETVLTRRDARAAGQSGE